MWKLWVKQRDLCPWQAVWFAPRLGTRAAKDPALEVTREVLQLLEAKPSDAPMRARRSRLSFYPAFVTPGLLEEAATVGVHVVHSEPRAHRPQASGEGRGCVPRLADLLPRGAPGVRARRGYAVDSPEGLREAWARLRRECPEGTGFELRPSRGQERCTSKVVAGEEDLETFDFDLGGGSAILEEIVAPEREQVLQTLFMVGSSPCPWFLYEDLPASCVEAARRMNQTLMLEGIWSVDFAADSTGVLVVMDIDAGNPSQKMSVQLWASRLLHPVAVSMMDYRLPEKGAPSTKDVVELLRSLEMRWDGDEGIFVCQHVPGGTLSFAIASSFGIEAAENMRARLANAMLESFDLAADTLCIVL